MTDIARWKRRAARKSEVKGRAQEPSHMFKMCRVVGCKNTPRAGTGDGLDTRFCRSHADHYARHGSPYHASFKASEINPYRRAAVEWLVDNEGDRVVANALQRVRGLYDRAGPHVEAFRLRGMSSGERAKAAWARLRQHEVDPRMVVAAWLAVEAKTAADPRAETKSEFKQVQAAKIVHRLASEATRAGSKAAARPLSCTSTRPPEATSCVILAKTSNAPQRWSRSGMRNSLPVILQWLVTVALYVPPRGS